MLKVSQRSLEQRSWIDIATLLGAALILMLWCATYWLLQLEHTTATKQAEHSTANLSQVFEESVVRSLHDVDSALLLLRMVYEDRNAGVDWRDVAFRINALSKLTIQYSIIDADGNLAGSTVTRDTPQMNLSDREHFKVHVDAKTDDLFISKPVVGRVSKKASLQLSRRLSTPAGQFDGVIVASIDPDHLAEVFGSIELGEGGSILLIGFDGVVRGRAGRELPRLGDRVAEIERMPDLATKERFWHNVLRDADAHLLMAYRIVRGHPLVVAVGISEGEIYRGFRERLVRYCVSAAILTMIIAWLVMFARARRLRLDIARQTLHQKAEELEITLGNINQGLCMFDRDHRIVVCNARYAETWGLTPDQVTPGTSLRQLILARIGKGLFVGPDPEQYMKERFARLHEPSDTIEVLSDGRSIRKVRKPLPTGGWVSTHEDITARRGVELQMAHMARHDALTDLPNRVQLQERLGQALAHARRGTGFAVMFLDLDHFKDVNDTLGHAVGDALLKEVALRLRRCVRETDLFARLGGDEFAVLQQPTSSASDVDALAQRIINVFQHPFVLENNEVTISTSIGITIAPDHGLDANSLLKNADLALYEAKAEGRGAFRYFEGEMDSKLRRRRALEQSLRAAVDRDEFELHYQPIVKISDGSVASFEALMRWRHPGRGLIVPRQHH